MEGEKPIAEKISRGYASAMSGLFYENTAEIVTLATWWPEEQQLVLKRLFAHYMVLLNEDQFAAADKIESSPGRVNYIVRHWTNDKLVRDEMDRIRLVSGALAKVPTKEQFAAEIYEVGAKAANVNDKLAAWKFFADVIGYTEKAGKNGINVNIQNNLGQKTMVVPVAASDEEWEKRAKAHALELHARHNT